MRLVVPRSIANTLVTAGAPVGVRKHAPVISKSCDTEQSALEGVTDITTGALVPNANGQVKVLVPGPKMLLSPAVNVVVTVSVPVPPQQASGNPLLDCAAVALPIPTVGIVACIRLQFLGLTLASTSVASGMPSPLVSQARVTAVVTVLPARC